MKPPDVEECPYEVDTTDETAAPTPEDTIDINNNNNDEDEKDDNTLHPQTARKQGCENHPEESLLSEDSDDGNDPYDDYSESTDDENNKKKSKRKTPTSTMWIPRKNH